VSPSSAQNPLTVAPGTSRSMAARAAATAWSERPCTTTLAPAMASARAIQYVEPVTRACLPVSLICMASFPFSLGHGPVPGGTGAEPATAWLHTAPTMCNHGVAEHLGGRHGLRQ